MKITHVKSFRYSLPFKKPLRIHGKAIQNREGFLLELKSDTGDMAYGEVAPLSGRSQESLKAVVGELQKIKNFLTQTPLPSHLGKLEGQLQKFFEPCQLSLSAQFGVEMAILNLISQQKHSPLVQIFHEREGSCLPINGLVMDTATLKETEQLLDEGYQTLKLKVRAENFEQEIKNIQNIQKACGEKAILRLDANQSLSFEQALHLGKTLGPAIEYIEEPFADIERIPEFYDETLIPVALDESLGKYEISQIQSISGVEVLVVKPTALGGLESVWQLSQKAQQRGIQVVVSSSFESGVGLLTLGHLAFAISRTTAAGLDTGKYFQKDLLKKPLSIDHGHLHLPANAIRADDLNFDLLEEVSL